MSRPAHEVALRAWLAYALAPEITGARVIYSDGGGPRPALPYASMRILTDAAVGSPDEAAPYDAESDTITRRLRSLRQGTLSVQVYGEGHHDLATRIEVTLWRQDVTDLLRASGLSVQPLSGVQRLSADSDGVIEDRSALDLSYRYSRTDEATTSEYIGSVALTQDIT